MLFWYLLFFPVVLYYLFYNNKNLMDSKSISNITSYYLLVSIVLVAFVGLRRADIGMDTLVYRNMFLRANNIEFHKAINSIEAEWGYLIFQKLVGRISLDFSFFCLISAIVSIIPVVIYIKMYSPIPALSIFLYIGFGFYTFVFSGIRQGLAIGMCCLAAIFIHKKKFLYYCFFVFLAVMFHKSALIFIPAYWMSRLKLNRITVFIFVIVAFLTYGNRNTLFEILNENARASYRIIEDTGGVRQLIFMILNVSLGSLFFMKEMKNDEIFKFSFFCIVVSICIMLVIRVNPALMRLYYYYYIFIIIYIPYIIKTTPEKSWMYLFLIAYIFVVIFFYNKFTVNADICILPYKFFWQ